MPSARRVDARGGGVAATGVAQQVPHLAADRAGMQQRPYASHRSVEHDVTAAVACGEFDDRFGGMADDHVVLVRHGGRVERAYRRGEYRHSGVGVECAQVVAREEARHMPWQWMLDVEQVNDGRRCAIERDRVQCGARGVARGSDRHQDRVQAARPACSACGCASSACACNARVLRCASSLPATMTITTPATGAIHSRLGACKAIHPCTAMSPTAMSPATYPRRPAPIVTTTGKRSITFISIALPNSINGIVMTSPTNSIP